ncbi:hypothetical protein GCM10009558_096450 [Virgisporangium aurantiacum]
MSTPRLSARSVAMSTQDVTTRTRRVDSERGALLLLLAMVGLMIAALFAIGA